jgi:DNA-entry nuclease
MERYLLGDLPGIGDIGGEGGTHTPITPADPSELRNPGANPNPVDPSSLPAYNGEPYIVIRNNMPDFASNELVSKSFEYYSPMDALGRCVYTVACVGKDIMPTEERGSIGSVKPSGWQTVKYDIVDGKYLYNRCHLIGFQLTGENANKSNLITGTRYLNIEGTLDFDNMIADYVKETGNHVLYRVTPVFEGNNLVASGVIMEGWSVEDNGDGICFYVYSYNNQPGIVINYANGDSALSEDGLPEAPENVPAVDGGDGATYVLNTNTKKFHEPDCGSVSSMSPSSRKDYTGDRESLIEQGYDPCGSCKP